MDLSVARQIILWAYKHRIDPKKQALQRITCHHPYLEQFSRLEETTWAREDIDYYLRNLHANIEKYFEIEWLPKDRSLSDEKLCSELEAVLKLSTWQDVVIDGQGIHATMGPITIEGVELGRFRITIQPSNNPKYMISATPLDPNFSKDDEGEDTQFCHPHISVGTGICLGEAITPIMEALRDGRFCEVFDILHSVLSHQGRDPLRSISSWKTEEDFPCRNCGSEEASQCLCDSWICDDCEDSCIHCNSGICDFCSYHCDDCDATICVGCYHRCDLCTKYLCGNCYTDALCKNCHKNQPEEEEEVA